MLYYSYDNLKGLKEQTINIETLFNMKRKIVCDNCKKSKKTKIIFKTLPQILIIANQIKKQEKEEEEGKENAENCIKVQFNYNMELNLKKYCLNNNNDANYKLISMIKFLENKKVLASYCKTKEDIWYCYKESKDGQNINEQKLSNKIKTYKKIPYLLVYQKFKKSHNI